MSDGFQLLHAFLAFEGIPRRWCNASFGEPDADLLNWRQRTSQPDEEDFDSDDTLAL